MNVYTTEEEQLEAIKLFFQRYGVKLILALIFLFTAYFGWKFWQQRQDALREQAARSYAQLSVSLSNHDGPAIKERALYITKQFPHTGYAELATLSLAKQYVIDKQYSQALAVLSELAQQTRTGAIANLAHLRLARIYLGEQQLDQAKAEIDLIKGDAFGAARDNLRGDVLLAQGARAEARAAYEQALQQLPKNSTMQSILLSKFNNLAQAEERHA